MKDNGYMIFDQFRIPRDSLLMRYSKLDREGNFSKIGNPKILYSTMVATRMSLLYQAQWGLSAGLTIGLRYGIVRTQFKDKAGSDEERSILDYQTQQHRLLPYLARVYAMNFSMKAVADMNIQMQEQVKKGDLSMIQEIHGIISGLKSMFTWWAQEGIETTRQCCGGAGYSNHSNLPIMLQDQTACVTLEGDNVVMLQQCAKFVLKKLGQAMGGSDVKGVYSYLNEVSDLVEKKCKI